MSHNTHTYTVSGIFSINTNEFFLFLYKQKTNKNISAQKSLMIIFKEISMNEKDKFSATEETVPRSAVLQSLFRMYPWLRLSIALLLFNAQ